MAHQIMIRGRDATGQWEMSEWDALVALSAVSAEPETLEEWAAAMRRYQPEHCWLERGAPLPALELLAPSAGPWCMIDLVGQTIVAGGNFELPDRRGAYKRNDDEEGEGFPIVWLAIPEHWLMAEDREDWKQLVQSRAADASAVVRHDFRAILFGDPLLEHLAAGVLAQAEQKLPEGEDDELLETRRIHAAWLMTPRADLQDQTPRQVLLARKDQISDDLEQRSQQWSRQGFAPPALSTSTAAYRYGGFGIAEIVTYFDMLRALLTAAWHIVRDRSGISQGQLVEELARQRDQWLDVTCGEGLSCTRRQLIESERRRLPVTSDGSHLDCDCPICQAEAEGQFGPSFIFFDGHHLEMEDDFAFSLADSYDEWEEQNEEYRRWTAEFDRNLVKRQADTELADEASAASERESSVWNSSFVDWDWTMSHQAPSSAPALAIAYPLAEIVNDLKQLTDDRQHLEALNEKYKCFRKAESDAQRSSAAEQLCRVLEEVARIFPELTSKSADLQSRLHEVLRHQSQ